MNGRDEIKWGPRVPKWKLRRLYESDAQGLLDDELLDDVGYTLLERCRDILKVASAQQGRIHCARCDRQGTTTFITLPPAEGDPRDVELTCPICGWQITWGDYHLSFKRKQLNPGGAAETFAAFAENFSQARTPQSKMLTIDRLIHEFHYSYRSMPDLPTRPVGVNLIEGHLEDVIAFLDDLSYGDDSYWKETLASFRTANDRVREHLRQGKKLLSMTPSRPGIERHD
jgi:hypothetical protein